MTTLSSRTTLPPVSASASSSRALSPYAPALGAALLRVARAMVAIGMHCDGLTVGEATRVIMDATLMDELPARREAERGTFDPGYGNYTLGKLLLLKLCRDVQAEQGAAFRLGAFHDAFLAHGAPPFPILRERLLANDDGRLL
jgi:uncharacterized protein (DUF885 family)